jgi:hypothetical protein
MSRFNTMTDDELLAELEAPCPTHTKGYPPMPFATVAMHPDVVWREGWNDAIRGAFESPYYRNNMQYGDGYACGSVRRREILRKRGLIG